ncbi:MAG: hypothetical protein RLZZ435_3611 [Cyanobacteriota bacterium]|jgi:hypothetical protein
MAAAIAPARGEPGYLGFWSSLAQEQAGQTDGLTGTPLGF